ncbi:MAG TPA: radical SAM protein [Acidobacteriota bacterium]|nr:radical SAM protein [Acidobacteriota bacterium]
MKVLLVAMPDNASCFDQVMKMPNLGLCSLAGSLPETVEVKIIDLNLKNQRIGKTITILVQEFQPDLVGLSAMSFQYRTASHLARLIKGIKPECKIALGGYHATLLHRELGESADAPFIDFIIRAEGEPIFRKLLERLESGDNDYSGIAGLSYLNEDGTYSHAEAAPLLELNDLPLPRREFRVLDYFHYLKRKFDCAETTRGCTFPCTFCSITRMYGKSFREFPIERVIEDLKILKRRGTYGVFFVDDNITLNVNRIKILCEEIIRNDLNTMDYMTQATVIGIASDRELSKLMARAGFKFVFLGIESGSKRNLELFKKSTINARTLEAVQYLQENGIVVLGGFIVGNPPDDAEDVKAVFDYCIEIGVDHPIVQCLTPYPKTQMRQELLDMGLVVNPDDLTRYNGFIANCRTEKLTQKQLSRLVLKEGAKLYWNPKLLRNSRLWRYNWRAGLGLIYNNYLFLKSGLKGDLFLSTHTL